MTDWEKSDQGNGNRVKGMAVGVREEFGIGEIENGEAKMRLAIHMDTEFASNDGLPSAYQVLELPLILKSLYLYLPFI